MSGVGDEAIQTVVGSGAVLHVRKGDTWFVVNVHGVHRPGHASGADRGEGDRRGGFKVVATIALGLARTRTSHRLTSEISAFTERSSRKAAAAIYGAFQHPRSLRSWRLGTGTMQRNRLRLSRDFRVTPQILRRDAPQDDSAVLFGNLIPGHAMDWAWGLVLKWLFSPVPNCEGPGAAPHPSWTEREAFPRH